MTLEITQLLAHEKLIGYAWLFKIKYKLDGTLKRYEINLVVLGCKQQYGVDYEGAFFPVAEMTTVRTFLVVVTIKD